MSTRALIARKTEDGFEANYHHWDGYPSGLGLTLVELYQGHFERDAEAMLRFLLDEHPAGWSTINGQDFSKPAGFGSPGPQCYCHGDRSETGSLITDKSNGFMGAEWLYVIDPKVSAMFIYDRRYANGNRAVQFFGVDASDVAEGVHWRVRGGVCLEDECPSMKWWEAISK